MAGNGGFSLDVKEDGPYYPATSTAVWTVMNGVDSLALIEKMGCAGTTRRQAYLNTCWGHQPEHFTARKSMPLHDLICDLISEPEVSLTTQLINTIGDSGLTGTPTDLTFTTSAGGTNVNLGPMDDSYPTFDQGALFKPWYIYINPISNGSYASTPGINFHTYFEIQVNESTMNNDLIYKGGLSGGAYVWTFYMKDQFGTKLGSTGFQSFRVNL